MSTESWIVIGVIVVVLVIVIGIYNSLVAGRQQVRNAWSQIGIQLKRRHDLIPNLVTAVKDSLQIEKQQVTAVVEARNQAISAATPDQSMKAENALSGALRSMLALVESYPQFHSQANVTALMEELATTENRISFARQHYNDSVQSQNIRVASFPAILFAGMFGFSSETMFEIPEAERAAVEAVPSAKLT